MSANHGTYIGPDPDLRGKGALLRDDNAGSLLAQFDDADLRSTVFKEDREDFRREGDNHGGRWLGFGWLCFAASDFRLDQVTISEIPAEWFKYAGDFQ